jgi:hypothetical protein
MKATAYTATQSFRDTPMHKTTLACVAIAGLATGAYAQLACDTADLLVPDATPLAVGTDPVWIETGDLDDDGLPDLVVVNRGSGDLSVFLASVGGGFHPETRLPLPFTAPDVARIGDVNNDGIADIVVSQGGDIVFELDPIAVLLGQGVGAFAPANLITDDSDSVAERLPVADIALADLDDDGNLDIVASSDSVTSPSGVQARFGAGDGTFTFQRAIASGISQTAGELVAADIDADGLIDLVVQSNQVPFHVLLNAGAELLDPPRAETSSSFEALTIRVEDLNGDGLPDIVAELGQTGRFAYPATGIATYSSPIPIPVDRTSDLELRDLNNDGNPDLIAATQAGVALLLGNGDGTFQTAVIDNPTIEYAVVAVLDIDQAGGLDVVAANKVSGTLDVFLNACELPPAFTITPPTSVVIDSRASATLTAIAGLGTAPISSVWQRDGAPVAGFPGLSGEVSATLSFAPTAPFQSGVFENVAGNTFGQAVAGPTVVAVRPAPGSAAGDINNDGSEDFFDLIDLLRLIDQSQD